VSYYDVQQLATIRYELTAAEAAVAYLERAWHELQEEPETANTRLSYVREAARNLEATYIIRLFSAF
jgi:hypothetical protein